MNHELLYTMALTRMTGFNFATALLLYRELGSATAVYEHRNDIGDVLPQCSPRLIKALHNWDEALQRAEAELALMSQKGITPLLLGDDGYPARLRECDDAPLVLYYQGSAQLNQRYVVSIVGTRHCTPYGQDLVRCFVNDLKTCCPQVLIVSGLAYGVDIHAHRNALQCGYDTVGVLAHGLDTIYPAAHAGTAREMVQQGGLLTEYMSGTFIDKANFVRRNRIVAGMADATVLVESAVKGGGLITCNIAQSYNRDVFAFPGAVGAPYSAGCNQLIRSNGAQLITKADDFVEAMGWQTEKGKPQAVERQLFPELSSEEQRLVDLLQLTNDQSLSTLSVRSNIPIAQATALLFQLEMKGVVKPLAGGCYHLLPNPRP